LNLIVHRPDCNRSNLVRDGPILQGPQAHLTAVAREFALTADHLFAHFRSHYDEYDIIVDINQIIGGIKMRPKVQGVGADVGENVEDQEGGIHNDKAPVVIQALPWTNAPKPDGCTAEFKEWLEECREYMHNFAMHTPYYFLAHDSRMKKATTMPKKAVDVGKGRREKKRRAPDTDEDDEGWFHMELSTCVCTDILTSRGWWWERSG
jgi:hypothetical protein